MFAVPRIKQLTTEEKRSARLKREAEEFAAQGAIQLANQEVTREDPWYDDLLEEEFKAAWEKARAEHEEILLSWAYHRYSEKGEIESRIKRELMSRCGDKKLVWELVDIIDARHQEKQTLMSILTKLLPSRDLCRGSNAQEEWEGLIRPYVSKEIREKIDTLQRIRREARETIRMREAAERRAEEESRLRAEAEERAEKESRLRVEAEQRNAELLAQVEQYERKR